MNPKAGLLLALLLLQGIFLGLGLKPMDKTQEVRVAETAREMVETGDWLIPRLNGELRLRKPPLAYWLTATSYSAFGSANEFTARFASAVFAALTVVVIFFWAKKSLGIESALTISVCLVSSYLALRYFRSAETDAILLFFVTAACVIAYQILFEAPTNARVVALYASMGLGFLAKGPAAVVIPLMLLIAFALLKKRYSALRKLINPTGIGLFFVIAFVWYAVIFKTLPDAATYWVAEELDASFVTGKYHEPFLWYFYSAFSFFLPWSLFIVPAAIWLYKTRPLSAPVQFALAWLLLTLLVLTLNPSKQIQYALLLTPALMIVIGHYLAASEGNYRRINVAIAAMVVIAATALLAVRIIEWRELGSLSLTPLGLLAAGTLLPVLIAAKMQLRLLRSVVLLAGLVTAGYVYTQRYIHEEFGERVVVRDFVARAKEYSPLFTYAAGNPRLSFYMQRVIPALTDESKLRGPLDEPVYVVVEGRAPEWQLPASLVLKHDKLELWKVLPRSDGTAK